MFKLELLPPGGGSESWVEGMNRAGTLAAGWLRSPGDPPEKHRACLWDLERGELRVIGEIDTTCASAVAVNDSGKVAGWTEGLDYRRRAFTWDYPAGRWRVHDHTGGQVMFTGVNDRSEIIGFRYAGAFTGQGFLLDRSGAETDLGTLGGSFTRPQSVSDTGDVVGISETGRGLRRAFRWHEGAMQDLDTFGGDESGASGVNGMGWIAGKAQAPDDSFQAFVWRDGSLERVAPEGLAWSEATGINDAGDVVGFGQPEGGSQSCPFLVRNGVFQLLDRLVRPEPDGQLETAASIGNNGVIVGTAFVNGRSQAYVLRPARGHGR